MKKIIIVIAAVAFLAVSTGVTFHLHYCMGKLAGWSLANNTSGNCGKCGMQQDEDQKKDCCKNDQKIIKYNSDQDTFKITENNFQKTLNITPAIQSYFTSALIAAIPAENFYTSPPPGFGFKRYLSNCVFLL